MQSICSHFSCDMACTFPQWQLLFVGQNSSPSQPCISCLLPPQKLEKVKFHFPNQFFNQKCLLSTTLSNEIQAEVYQELLGKICFLLISLVGFPSGSEGQESTCRKRNLGLFPSEKQTSWKKEWLPTLVFLPEESYEQKSLEGYSPCSVIIVMSNSL